MINFKPFEEPSIFDPEEIHTYGDAVRFAYSVFNFFNGKVNPHFPAYAMVVSNDIQYDRLAVAIGDVVVLYAHHIIYEIDRHEKDDRSDKLKGNILMTIIHELYKKSADIKIEEACYVMANNYICDLSMYGLLEIDYSHMTTAKIPCIDFFFDYDDERISEAVSNVDKIFKRVSNPSLKALWVLDNSVPKRGKTFANVNEWADEPSEYLNSIYARVLINGVPIKENYIFYNGIWGSKEDIMGEGEENIVQQGKDITLDKTKGKPAKKKCC